MADIDDSNFQDVLSELHEAADKWRSIGEALGCPTDTLKQIQKTVTNDGPADCLSDMLAHRKKQLTPSRLTWTEIIVALRAKNVSEEALANRIAKTYCPSEYREQSPPVNGDGKIYHYRQWLHISGVLALGILVALFDVLSSIVYIELPEPSTDSSQTHTGPTHSSPLAFTGKSARDLPPLPDHEVLYACPDLGDVDVIKWQEGGETKTFRLIDFLGKCDGISNQLKIPKSKYDGWVREKQGTQREICHEVLQHWLNDGAGDDPVSWRKLIEVLEDVQLGKRAKQLKAALLSRSLHKNSIGHKTS